ncbi:MAG: hypothetical protein WCK28_01870 [Burkholderiales bacterium]
MPTLSSVSVPHGSDRIRPLDTGVALSTKVFEAAVAAVIAYTAVPLGGDWLSAVGSGFAEQLDGAQYVLFAVYCRSIHCAAVISALRAAARSERRTESRYEGTATAAMIETIATTTMISTRVNPPGRVDA